MDRAEFVRLIEETDDKLTQQNIPLHVRPIAAFKEIAGDFEGPIGEYGIDPRNFPEFVGPNFIQKIDDWYRERYGDRINPAEYTRQDSLSHSRASLHCSNPAGLRLVGRSFEVHR